MKEIRLDYVDTLIASGVCRECGHGFPEHEYECERGKFMAERGWWTR